MYVNAIYRTYLVRVLHGADKIKAFDFAHFVHGSAFTLA